MRKAIRLRFRKWWYYLIPGARRWLKDAEKDLNKPERLDKISEDCVKKWAGEVLKL